MSKEIEIKTVEDFIGTSEAFAKKTIKKGITFDKRISKTMEDLKVQYNNVLDFNLEDYFSINKELLIISEIIKSFPRIFNLISNYRQLQLSRHPNLLKKVEYSMGEIIERDNLGEEIFFISEYLKNNLQENYLEETEIVEIFRYLFGKLNVKDKDIFNISYNQFKKDFGLEGIYAKKFFNILKKRKTFLQKKIIFLEKKYKELDDISLFYSELDIENNDYLNNSLFDIYNDVTSILDQLKYNKNEIFSIVLVDFFNFDIVELSEKIFFINEFFDKNMEKILKSEEKQKLLELKNFFYFLENHFIEKTFSDYEKKFGEKGKKDIRELKTIFYNFINNFQSKIKYKN